MEHHFNPKIAKLVGIKAAIIFNLILSFSIQYKISGKNIHNNKAWVRLSIRELEVYIPYMSARNIRTAIDKLEGSELILVDNFNDHPCDRTKWYTHTEIGSDFGVIS